MSLFAEPSALLLILVLPALWLLGKHASLLQGEALRRFGDPELLARTSSLPRQGITPGRVALRWGGLVLLIVALARPQVGRQPKELARTGRDLVVALDLSRSMRVEDVGTTRLRIAKRLAWQLAAARPGDRIGLVIFAGAAFLQLPPTSDLSTFQLFLDHATFEDIGDPATDINAALHVAERALRREGTAIGSRAVILLSDGERSEGALDDILPLLRRARLPVFTVGVGTVDGGRVPGDSGSPLGPWHVDDIGRPVISHLDEETLKRIGFETGGSYARFDDPAALEKMTQALASLEARSFAARPAEEPTERYQWPLALGVLLLLMEVGLGMGLPRRGTESQTGNHAPRPATAGPARHVAAVLLVLLVPLLSCSRGTGEARKGGQLYEQGKYLEAWEAYQSVLRQQGGPDLRYNAGNALYRLKQYPEASKSWREALSGADPRLREWTYFNMGNAFVRASEDANALSGYLERSLDAYEEALRLDPDDKDAKWNLEIALRRYGSAAEEGSRGRGGRADYGSGGHQEGYEGSRETAVGAVAGGGQGGDEGESVEEMDPEQARSLLEAVERQQLSTHQGKRTGTGHGAERDW